MSPHRAIGLHIEKKMGRSTLLVEGWMADGRRKTRVKQSGGRKKTDRHLSSRRGNKGRLTVAAQTTDCRTRRDTKDNFLQGSLPDYRPEKGQERSVGLRGRNGRGKDRAILQRAINLPITQRCSRSKLETSNRSIRGKKNGWSKRPIKERGSHIPHAEEPSFSERRRLYEGNEFEGRQTKTFDEIGRLACGKISSHAHGKETPSGKKGPFQPEKRGRVLPRARGASPPLVDQALVRH